MALQGVMADLVASGRTTVGNGDFTITPKSGTQFTFLCWWLDSGAPGVQYNPAGDATNSSPLRDSTVDKNLIELATPSDHVHLYGLNTISSTACVNWIAGK